MTQGDLFAAVEARDEALQRAERNAAVDFNAAARIAVSTLRALDTFTTDDVWDLLDRNGITTHDRRALGSVMKRLEREGRIAPTGNWQQSRRVECHARPVRVWQAVRQ